MRTKDQISIGQRFAFFFLSPEMLETITSPLSQRPNRKSELDKQKKQSEKISGYFESGLQLYFKG